MDNNNQPTPETDAVAAYEGNWDTKALRMTAHARKLERERDEARKELEEYRSIAENIGAKKAISEKEKAIRERDELQKAVNGLCEYLGISPANTTLLTVEVLKIKRERDEVRELHKKSLREREASEREADATLERAHKAERERDEAQAVLERIDHASMSVRSTEEDYAEWEKAVFALLDLCEERQAK